MSSVDFDNDLLLVTCASGKICSYLLPLLTQRWKRLRLVCHTAASKARLQSAYPTAEVLALDLFDRAACHQAMQGVTACFHIGPSMHAHETTIGINMIDAAVAESGSPRRRDGRAGNWKLAHMQDDAAIKPSSQQPASGTDTTGGGGGGGGTFQHFIFSSVLNTQLRKLLNHDCKRYVEEHLIESGLGYTILQPTHFLQNMTPGPLELQRQLGTSGDGSPVYTCAWDLDVPYSFLDLADMAAVTSTVFAQRGRHYGAQYALCSTDPLTYRQLLAEVGEVLGCEVRVEAMSLDQATKVFVDRFAGDGGAGYATRDGIERLLMYYCRHGLVGSRTVLGFLLGGEPMTVKGWAERVLREGR